MGYQYCLHLFTVKGTVQSGARRRCTHRDRRIVSESKGCQKCLDGEVHGRCLEDIDGQGMKIGQGSKIKLCLIEKESSRVASIVSSEQYVFVAVAESSAG